MLDILSSLDSHKSEDLWLMLEWVRYFAMLRWGECVLHVGRPCILGRGQEDIRTLLLLPYPRGGTLEAQYPLPTSVSCKGGSSIQITGTDEYITIKGGYVPLALHFP